MRYIGLDLSLTGTGCCVVDDDGKRLEGFEVGYKLPRTATIRELVERLVEISTRVIECVARHQQADQVDVVIENYSFSRIGNQTGLGEIQGTVKTQLWLALSVTPKIAQAGEARAWLGPTTADKTRKLTVKDQVDRRLRALGICFDQKTEQNKMDAYVLAEWLRRTALQPAQLSLGIEGEADGQARATGGSGKRKRKR